MTAIPYVQVFGRVERPGVDKPNDLVAHQSNTVVPEHFLIRRGLPVVPEAWCEAEAEVSSNGLVYTGRPSLSEIHTDSTIKFLPYPEYWDTITNSWSPVRSDLPIDYRLFFGDPAPQLDEIDYRIGRELFTVPSISMLTGSVLTSDAVGSLADAREVTFALAVRPKTTGTMLAFADGSEVNLTDRGLAMTDPNVSLNYPMLLTGQATVIVLKFALPKVVLTAAVSPRIMYSGSGATKARTQDLAMTFTDVADLIAIDIWVDNAPPAEKIVADYTSVIGADQFIVSGAS